MVTYEKDKLKNIIKDFIYLKKVFIKSPNKYYSFIFIL
mgnify:CR=1 FL=1